MTKATPAMLTYLDRLRESGVTNMYGAGTYVMHAFGLSDGAALAVVDEWMATFDQRHPPTPTPPQARMSIRRSTYRGHAGFTVSGTDGRGRTRQSIFTLTRESAERIKAKCIRGDEITLADFAAGTTERIGGAVQNLPRRGQRGA